MIKDITIGQYFNVKSIIHDLDPRTKLFGVMVLVISIFIINDFISYIVALFTLLYIIKKSKIPFMYLIRGLKSLAILFIISFIVNLFMTNGEVIFKIGFLKITREGLQLSIKMIIRLVFIVICSSLLTLTTTPLRLTDGLEKTFSPLKKLNVPVSEIALMMSISLRFIPIFTNEIDKIMKAQLSRGANFESKNLIVKAKSLMPIFIPLFISAFKKANELSFAMEARCYVSGNKRTKLYPLEYKKIDKVAYVVLIVYFIIILVIRVIGIYFK